MTLLTQRVELAFAHVPTRQYDKSKRAIITIDVRTQYTQHHDLCYSRAAVVCNEVAFNADLARGGARAWRSARSIALAASHRLGILPRHVAVLLSLRKREPLEMFSGFCNVALVLQPACLEL
jgi:hypothetical protein